MEFGSDYVYWYDEPEFEIISDEEYDLGMRLSCSDPGSDSDDDASPSIDLPKHDLAAQSSKTSDSPIYVPMSPSYDSPLSPSYDSPLSPSYDSAVSSPAYDSGKSAAHSFPTHDSTSNENDGNQAMPNVSQVNKEIGAIGNIEQRLDNGGSTTVMNGSDSDSSESYTTDSYDSSTSAKIQGHTFRRSRSRSRSRSWSPTFRNSSTNSHDGSGAKKKGRTFRRSRSRSRSKSPTFRSSSTNSQDGSGHTFRRSRSRSRSWSPTFRNSSTNSHDGSGAKKKGRTFRRSISRSRSKSPTFQSSDSHDDSGAKIRGRTFRRSRSRSMSISPTLRNSATDSHDGSGAKKKGRTFRRSRSRSRSRSPTFRRRIRSRRNRKRGTKVVRKWRERELDGIQLEDGKKERRADTNIISVNFEKLIAPANMHTGDPIQCSACGAVMSLISKITTEGENKQWICEFCGTPNIVDVEEEEIPKTKDVTFMMEPALSTTASQPTSVDESLVIFCIDISGSMGIDTKMPKGMNLLRSTPGNQNRYLNMFVSRLKAVKIAVSHQLQEMVAQHPNQRVALIAFNDKVCIFGDGSTTPISVVDDDQLTDSTILENIGLVAPQPKAIKHSIGILEDKLMSLRASEYTALGPALLIGITMASQVQGSKVIICTDGMANIGVGRLDKIHLRGEDAEVAVDFYDRIGSVASSKGVTISVTSFKGTDCKLAHLGRLADVSGGQVNIVDSGKLAHEFSTILSDSVIATNAVATCIIDKGLFFHYEKTESNKVVRHVGNVTSSTEITFEYGVKCEKDKLAENKTKSSAKAQEDTGSQDTKPSTSQDTKPSTSQDTKPSTSQDTKPSTSQDTKPSTSQDTKPSTSQDTKPSTSQDTKPSTSQDTKPSTSQDTKPSTSQDTKPSTSQNTIQSTSNNENVATEQNATLPEPGPSASASRKSEETAERARVPFQLQIKYTDLDGAVGLRVVTESRPLTHDRQEAEKSLNMQVLGKHTAQTTAALALDGNYSMSRGRALMNQRLAWRYTNATEGGLEYRKKYKKVFGKIQSVENYMNHKQKNERSELGITYSDEEEDYDSPPVSPSALSGKPQGPKRTKKANKRSTECSDSTAKIMFKMKKSSRYLSESDSD